MEVKPKTALIIYFVVTPLMVITGYFSRTALMGYVTVLALISIFLTISEGYN